LTVFGLELGKVKRRSVRLPDPINLTLELLDDRWSLLILRNIIFAGVPDSETTLTPANRDPVVATSGTPSSAHAKC